MNAQRVLRAVFNRTRWLLQRARGASPGHGSYFEFLEADFDRRYGVETAAIVTVDAMQVDAGARAQMADYVPTPFGLLPEVVRATRVDPTEFCFIDLGSGKGRVLVLAAEAGFDEVIGVELSELHEVAERNIRAYAARSDCPLRIFSRRQDVTTFEFPQRPLFVFYFNAFFGPVLERTLENLRASIEAHPRAVLFVWHGKRYFPEKRLQETFARHAFLKPMVETEDYTVFNARLE
ncbi:MAG: class I SAM-dependent methyltransferase [Myxococcales bacterium]